MAEAPTVFRKLQEICLALPDTKMTMTWDEPHFRVKDKIFAGCGMEDGKLVIGFKLEKPHALLVTEEPRFRPAKYGGKHGWVSMDASGRVSWARVREFVHESYRLIAPKSTLKKWEGSGASSAGAKKTARKKTAARR